MPNRQIIRLAAMGLMTVAGGFFAVQAGLVPVISGDEQATPARQAVAISQPSSPSGTSDTAPDMMPLPASVADAPVTPTHIPPLPDTPDAVLMQPDLPQPGSALSDRMASTSDTPLTATDTQNVSAFGLPCGLTVTASAEPAAMVALDIMDPCQPAARIVIEHSGLTLTEATDAMGLLTTDIPVFETPAFFTIRMGEVAQTARVTVPDLAEYDRVAVAWEDARDLELHALEFGADYGEPGHIWAGNTGSIARAETGTGGFVTRLGNDGVEAPMMAEIYTFPRDTLTREGSVRILIEAPVTHRNCGLPTIARTIETDPENPATVTELTFTLPDCDAVGDYLVLQNLLQDLRLAAN
ncbi:hypothetical protein E2K80_16315 [Rhodophyticola sp. CCM32]|uniref:hypothetical protein n=1 Tax=Rhodophyticola sp. CCM32 TaxID=2916397 RepID=UPI00107F98A9|nr:hypothetical protein [Rhodophyticola sp. CCM32]QBY02105.1 hypothetical protein E2K80_16315 [Rhodophyticola sp. CCM32]